MAGGKARPKKDQCVKISSGEPVKDGQILVRNLNAYKAGANVSGINTLHATCNGTIYFSKKRINHGKTKTFIHIKPDLKKAS